MTFTRINLTGSMGSGKRTVARILTELLRQPLTDLDELIINEAGISIPEIF